MMEEVRIGVFVCRCGTNIGGFVDVPALVEYAKGLPYVVFSLENLYTCSETGLTEMKAAIADQRLNRVVVASCTPRTHEPLFRSACREAGLNPYLFEFVNIRDQCSWVHMHDPEAATRKAKDLIRMGVARAALLEPQEEIEVEVTSAALIIGGGITGMTCALSLADRGFEVTLVEREAELGGLLTRIHTLFPTLEDAAELIDETRRAVILHRNIEVLTAAKVKGVQGFVGNYDVIVQQAEKEIPFKAGVIVVATGAEEYKPVGRYGYDGVKVVTQLELEKRLKEGTMAATRIVMIQCVGAREAERAYCSKICCMTAVKNALRILEGNPEAQIFLLYRDLQAYGTVHEDVYRQAREAGVLFIPHDPYQPPVVEAESVRVWDELLGEELQLPYDLIALSTPLIAHPDAGELAQMLKVPLDEDGFFLEAHVKLRPLDFATDGIYVCGAAHWPATVRECIAQAYGAASRASIPLSRGRVTAEPIVAMVDEEACVGCGLCEAVCPFKAIRVETSPKGRVAMVIPASCKGCGVCGAACPQRAITMCHFTDEQVLAEVLAFAAEE